MRRPAVPPRSRFRGVLIGMAVLALGGCSQTAALAPVSGGQLAKVRFAANDVLVDQHVQILDAPVCTEVAEAVSCHGSTLTGDPITVTSTADDKANMQVQVGTTTIYAGSVMDVLNAHARPSS